MISLIDRLKFSVQVSQARTGKNEKEKRQARLTLGNHESPQSWRKASIKQKVAKVLTALLLSTGTYVASTLCLPLLHRLHREYFTATPSPVAQPR